MSTLIYFKNKKGQYFIKCEKCNYTEPQYITFIRKYCPFCGVKFTNEKMEEDTEYES